MTEFFRDLADQIKDEDTSIMADGHASAEFTGYIDSGSYIFNALLSGSLYGGFPNNKVTALAGETSVGKTFFALDALKYFLIDNPEAGAIYYDTESATTKEMMASRGIDVNRVIIAEPETVERFRHHALKMLENYQKTPEKDRPPFMTICDSLGNLSTEKELGDAIEGKNVRDMTRAQQLRGTFRTLGLKLSKAQVPMIVTNHTYDKIGSMFPEKVMSGGGGLKFVASGIVFLGKAKEKDGNEVIGIRIRATMFKSRLSKENKQVVLRLSYKTGLDRYYGLVDLAVKYGIFKKVSTRIVLPDGKKTFEKTINNNPEEFYTDEIMAQLEVAANKEFSYGDPAAEDENENEAELLLEQSDE